jgi:CHAT domain-containing protein
VARKKKILKPEPLDSIIQNIPAETIVLQYFSDKKHFFLLTIGNKHCSVNTIQKDSTLVKSIIFLSSLHDTDPISLMDYTAFIKHSTNAFRILVEPFLVPSASNLIIIPDGELCGISFDALIRSYPDTSYIDYARPDYLIKHLNIRSAFSSNMLNQEVTHGLSRKSRILAMSYGTTEDKRNSLANLSGSDRELEMIRKQFRGRFLKDESATETAFKKNAEKYDLVHLALHGNAGFHQNDSTMLIFRKMPAESNDGILMAEELIALGLNAGLVVLSSCQTGTGRSVGGEGIYSMARAFAVAGCPSVIVTLWSIADYFSVPIISGFYKELRKSWSPSMALRKSKLDYLAHAGEYNSHPRFWAAFMPLGGTFSK